MSAADDAQRAASQRSTEVLTNASVVRMVTGQVPKDIILAKLQSSTSNFNLSTTGPVRLNDSTVSQDLINVMMMPPTAPRGFAAITVARRSGRTGGDQESRAHDEPSVQESRLAQEGSQGCAGQETASGRLDCARSL